MAPCGSVEGLVRYNKSSSLPDTAINTTEEATPFYIDETPSLAMKVCPTNPLDRDEFCNITWTVNATGAIDSVWKFGVLFNSSSENVTQNHTDNATVTIFECIEELTVWSPSNIDFGASEPNTPGSSNPALDNENKKHNISNTGTCTLKIWVKGTDLENNTYNSVIGVGNFSWSNETNNYNTSYSMTESYALINSSLTSTIQNVTTYYWLAIPPVYTGKYNGTITICGNYTSIC